MLLITQPLFNITYKHSTGWKGDVNTNHILLNLWRWGGNVIMLIFVKNYSYCYKNATRHQELQAAPCTFCRAGP